MNWQAIILLLLGGAFVWLIYTRLRQMPPGQFSKSSILKSLDVLGILAIGFVILIWLLVLMLKN